MITIQGLTERQKSIMDMLWSMDTMDKVTAFVKALPTKQDQADAASLIQIAVEETLEQEGGLDAYKAAAAAAIASARS
jgi:acetylglutamate synthase